MLFVDPAYTSQRCSVCGYTTGENRKTQADFVSLACGHVNAAKSIAFRAAVNPPIALRVLNKSMEEMEGQTHGHELCFMPTTSVVGH